MSFLPGRGPSRDGLEVGEADIWRKNVLHQPTVTGTRIPDLPPPGRNDCHHRGEKAEGAASGGRTESHFPAAQEPPERPRPHSGATFPRRDVALTL